MISSSIIFIDKLQHWKSDSTGLKATRIKILSHNSSQKKISKLNQTYDLRWASSTEEIKINKEKLDKCVDSYSRNYHDGYPSIRYRSSK